MKKGIALMAAVVILITIFARVVDARNTLWQHAFYGSITVDGSPATTGTRIEVRGPGVLRMAGNPLIVTESGRYGAVEPARQKLVVQGDVIPGTDITFHVNGRCTGQTYQWRPGNVTRLDLIVTTLAPVTLVLNQGWNLLSTPVALDPSCDTWGKLQQRGDGLNLDPRTVAYHFDSSTQLWGEVLADYQIKPCDAIYVKMASADYIPALARRTSSTPRKQLDPGWNLVSLAASGSMGLKAALSSVRTVSGDLTGYSQVSSPALNQSGWTHVKTGADNPLMVPGKGYWVFMVNGGTLVGINDTPF